jgi:hypothetical protein
MRSLATQSAVTGTDAERLLSLRGACGVRRRLGMGPPGDCAGKAPTETHGEGNAHRSSHEYDDDVGAARAVGAQGNEDRAVTHRRGRTAKQVNDVADSEVTPAQSRGPPGPATCRDLRDKVERASRSCERKPYRQWTQRRFANATFQRLFEESPLRKSPHGASLSNRAAATVGRTGRHIARVARRATWACRRQ